MDTTKGGFIGAGLILRKHFLLEIRDTKQYLPILLTVMAHHKHTEEMIEELVDVTCGAQAGAREKHVYREALRSLVRLAKSEQMYEMKADIQTLVSVPADTLRH